MAGGNQAMAIEEEYRQPQIPVRLTARRSLHGVFKDMLRK
jgi:hypothetical protein